MKFYLIKILQKEDGFDKLFEALRLIGKFFINNKEIISKSSLEIDEIKNIFCTKLSDSDKIEITEITDEKFQIEDAHALDWIERERFVDRSKELKDNEYDSRIEAMYEILENAVKIKNNNGGESKTLWQRIKSKKAREKTKPK